ncbi:hypothetical protein QTI06_14515 [Clostridium perfringens]|nr:hypothetical protein [Clostridium perfringens]
MSKLNIRLSYKNACILKHALREKVEDTRIFLESPGVILEEKESKKIKKEHEEEKRALAAITEEIERYSIRFPRRSK